jgi:hypothetical protein
MIPLAETALQYEVGVPLILLIGVLNLVIRRQRANRRNRP